MALIEKVFLRRDRWIEEGEEASPEDAEVRTFESDWKANIRS